MNPTPQKLQLLLEENILYMHCSGKWDDFFVQNNYIPQMTQELDNYTMDHFIPFVNILSWELPGFKATTLLHQFHMELAKRFCFHPVVLIAPVRHLSLYEEVINDFKLAGTGAQAKAFEDYDTAKAWLYQQNISQVQLPEHYPFQQSRTA